MDTAQAVLLFVVVILTLLLSILGIQVFFILRELKQTVSKANKVLDDTGTITESVSMPISKLSSIVSGVKTGVAIASLFNRVTKSDHKKHSKEEEE